MTAGIASADGAHRVAGDLDRLSGLPELAAHAPALRMLARAIRPDSTMAADVRDGWADLDLVATFGQVHQLEPPAPSRPWYRALVEAAPAVLAFLPILLSWLGLAFAVAAYHGLEADAASRARVAGRSFLELWQTGFDGRLPAPLRFGYLAGYIAVSVFLLIGLGVLGGILRRRDDEDGARRHRQVQRQLLPVLTLAQVELNRRRLGTPARFAAELSQAAGRLTELLQWAAQVQRSSGELAERNAAIATQLREAIDGSREAVAALRATAGDVRTATTSMQDASVVLRDEVTARVAAAADRLDATVTATAAQIAGLQDSGQRTLESVAQRIDGTFEKLTDRVEATTAALTGAGSRYADAIALAAEKAASEVTDSCQEAVAATAVSLASNLAGTAEDLRLILARLTAGADGYQAAAARTAETFSGYADAVAATLERLEAAVAELRLTLAPANSAPPRLARPPRPARMPHATATRRLARTRPSVHRATRDPEEAR